MEPLPLPNVRAAMGAIITYTIAVSYAVLVQDTMLTASDLEVHPYTAQLAPPFLSFLVDIANTEADERKLELAARRAHSLLEKAHEDLYEEMVVVADVLHHLKDTTLSDRFEDCTRLKTTKRNTFVTRLARARSWLAAAQSVSFDPIRYEVPILEARIAATQAAETANANAEEAVADFCSLGKRKDLIDRANGLRIATYGALGEIAHSRPDLGTSFPESFFRHTTRSRTRKPDVAKARVATAQKLLDKRQKQLADAEAAQKTASAKAAADQQKKLESKRNAAQKRVDRALEKLAKLKDQLGEGDNLSDGTSETEAKPLDESKGALAEKTAKV